MPKESGRRQPTRKKSTGLWWVVGIGGVAAAALIGLSVWSSRPQAPTTPANPNVAANIKSDKDLGANRNVMGRADAKVELVEYGDFL